jgi:ABC-type multidrug transport system fused ATPase/permease subunit
MLTALIASALLVDPVAALAVIGAGAVLFSVMRPLTALGRRNAKALSAAQLTFASGIHDAVNLAEETKVFGAGEAQRIEIGNLIDAARHRLFVTQFLARLVPGTYQSLMLLMMVGGLGVLAATGIRHVASLGAVVLLLIRASSYGQQFQGGYQLLHQTMPFMDRLARAEARYQDAKVLHGSRLLTGIPTIRFADVSYAYHADAPALQEVSFEIEPGKAIGVVGPTGAGKSTLIQVLLGLRTPTSGSYFLEDELASNLSELAWTQAFAYVPQEPKLLHGTVAENISFFRKLDNHAIERAARLAHIHADIMGWQDQYGTIIGQRADAVSGGQRQRICLARALAGRPFVLVLDEPTSNLDPHSESLVQESLETLKGSMTLILIAHRLSTLDVCDSAMVIRTGRIEAFGPTHELNRTNAFYRDAAKRSHSATVHTTAAEP